MAEVYPMLKVSLKFIQDSRVPSFSSGFCLKHQSVLNTKHVVHTVAAVGSVSGILIDLRFIEFCFGLLDAGRTSWRCL